LLRQYRILVIDRGPGGCGYRGGRVTRSGVDDDELVDQADVLDEPTPNLRDDATDRLFLVTGWQDDADPSCTFGLHDPLERP
jgi:hypothetical protein